jgi:hypothetical protein
MAHYEEPEVENLNEFSFDLNQIKSQIKDGNDFTATIRGHLYIESILIHLIQEALPRQDLLQVDRISFNSKVELCASLGLIPEYMIPIYKKINQLRNYIAHNLSYQLTDKDKADLLNCFTKEMRDALTGADRLRRPVSPSEISLGRILSVTIVISDFGRQRYRILKEQKADRMAQLQATLEEAIRALRTTDSMSDTAADEHPARGR